MSQENVNTVLKKPLPLTTVPDPGKQHPPCWRGQKSNFFFRRQTLIRLLING